MASNPAVSRAEYETEVDATLASSFPASDPPSWTFGASPWMEVAAPAKPTPVPAAVDVIIQDGYRVAGIPLASVGDAIVLTAMVPLGILIVGVPVVVLIRGLANAISWLSGNG